MKISSLNLFIDTDQIAWVGAGGKTSLMFKIANEVFPNKCFITTTTKMAESETSFADQITRVEDFSNFDILNVNGINLIFKGNDGNEPLKINGFDEGELSTFSSKLKRNQIPLFIEADGSKRKPLKFPAEHEPNIPQFVNKICIVVGLSAVGKPLSEENFHRPELISKILNIPIGEIISIDHIYEILAHTQGGLKNIPAKAKTIVFLHQADQLADYSQANGIALKLQKHFDHVVLSCIRNNNLDIIAHWGKIGCVILAAGSASRFGSPKQLAIYRNKTFIENIIDTVLKINFSDVVVILGAYFDQILPFIHPYKKIHIINNFQWEKGQSSSVADGVKYLSDKNLEAIIFLLVDQPQITTSLIHNILNLYAYQKNKIIVHDFNGQNRHPILFAKDIFSELMQIQGEKGGSQLFEKYVPAKIKLEDSFLAFDIDTVEDLDKL
jgi:molybdenum cofactor cytidylyltransferase